MSNKNFINEINLLSFLKDEKLIKGSCTCELFRYYDKNKSHFIISSTKKSLFVRITKFQNHPNLIFEINNFLIKNKVEVIPFEFFNIKYNYKNIEFSINARPYIIGRKYNNSLFDFNLLVTNLSKIHKTLKTYPEKHLIKLQANKFNSQLLYFRNQLKKNHFIKNEKLKCWFNDNLKIIEDKFFNFDINLGLDNSQQVLHGDIHTGNVIFIDNKRIKFFDFDETYKVFLNPIYDLLYVFERFCFYYDNSLESLYKRYEIIKLSYDLNNYSLKDLLIMISNLSLRLILISIKNFHEERILLNLSELERHIENHHKANKFISINEL